MSFGFGPSDIVNLGRLSWALYQACKEAPSTFGQLSHEVLSLNAVLKEIEEAYQIDDLTQSRQEGFSVVVTGCKSVLEELQVLLKRYEKVGTRANRTLDRIGWATVNISDLRQRLSSRTLLLTAFLRYVDSSAIELD